MQTLQINSFPIEQISNLEGLEWRLGQWFAGTPFPVRQIATSRPFDMSRPLQQMQRKTNHLQRLVSIVKPLMDSIDHWLNHHTGDPQLVIDHLKDDERTFVLEAFRAHPQLQIRMAKMFQPAAQIPADADQYWIDCADALSSLLWPLGWQIEMQRFYQQLQQGRLRAIDHYVMTWEPATMDGAVIQSQLRHAIGREVHIVEMMPSIIGCAYTEEALRLVPTQPGFPFLAILVSHEIQGDWDGETLHALLDVPFDVSIVVDSYPESRNKATRMAEIAHSASRMVQRDEKLLDTRAERVYHDSYRVLHELRHQALHYVTIAILVPGETEAALENNVAEIAGRLGTSLRLTRISGTQGELLKLWSPQPTKRLDIPQTAWNMLSHGLGCCACLVGYHRAQHVTGLLWGFDAQRHSPLFYDLFANNQAAHMCILGKTGYGKTLFLNQVTLRAAAILGWKVIAFDAENNAARIENAAGIGSRCNYLGLHCSINILDVVFDDEGERGWLADQVQHVIDQLGMLLGEPGFNEHGKRVVLPRRWTTTERGLLDQALSNLYSTVDPHAPAEAMPRLSDFIDYLLAIERPETDLLAQELHDFLSGSLAATFDATTNVDWDFTSDINYFDFRKVPETFLAFFYGQAVGAVYRYMRDPSRDTSRPTLFIIDEFYLVTQTDSVASMAATLAKVARKYKIALMPADQNPGTYLGNKFGLQIWENSVAKALFHLDDLPARQMGDAISDLTDSHVAFLTQAQPGEAIMIFKNDVYQANVQINQREARFLIGS